MDCLKSLPVAPLAVALGELAGGVILLSGIQLVLLIGLLGAGGNPALIVSVIAFLIPFDLLMLAMSNTVFLIYPVRFAPGTSADFQMVGRTMLFMLLQFLLLIPALGIPAGLGRAGVCAQRLPSPRLRGRRVGLACGRAAALAVPARRRCSRGLIPGRKRRRSEGIAEFGIWISDRERVLCTSIGSAFSAPGSCRCAGLGVV